MFLTQKIKTIKIVGAICEWAGDIWHAIKWLPQFLFFPELKPFVWGGNDWDQSPWMLSFIFSATAGVFTLLGSGSERHKDQA